MSLCGWPFPVSGRRLSAPKFNNRAPAVDRHRPKQINQNSISGLIARARRPGSGGGVVAREAERLPERSVEVVFDQALLGGGGNANA